MSIAYVIHCDADLDFVKRTLLPPLPSNGFDRWVSSAHLRDRNLSIPEVMRACSVILAVISRAAADSEQVHTEIEVGRASPNPVIVVQAEDLTQEERTKFPEEVWLLPQLDLRPPPEARQELAALLPPPTDETTALSNLAQPIEWNEEIFSEALRNVLDLHDHNQTKTLIETFTRHIEQRPYPYAAKHANTDLGMLRRERQFTLMQRYAEAVIASGTRDEKVRRQYAQSLIEQRSFDRALDVLNSIVADPKSDPDEVAEAYGLIGRAYKQQYVDEPRASGSHELLRRAIEAYHYVYANDPSKVWHGVNTASCIVRAHRDGVEGVQLAQATEIAERLLEQIARLEQTGKAEVWDYASRVEALIVLERYEAASVALDQYLSHPDMHAFEVSATHRQFDELLELGQDPRGRPILDRLWEAVQRYRATGLPDQPTTFGTSESVVSEPVMRSLLIRVTNPQWQPGPVVDLVPLARLGTIVSAKGSDASVKKLLEDPDVIAIDDSLPGGNYDCDRSIPYIKVADNYSGPSGPYVEQGAGALIAIIDNGIDVLHQAFLDGGGKSRIVGIWDQTDPTGPPPGGFDFGTYHCPAQIAQYVQQQLTPAGLGRNLNGGHGTHVASIAAGRKIGAFAGGVAPEARLLVVIADGQSPIGYSTSHVTALAFIDATANQLKLPVVINVSQGMNAGAHDGKSLLEVAFDEFAQGGRRPGRVIVKSAGNERGKHGHARVTMGKSSAETLRWSRPPLARGSERLELWWNSADEFEFQLSDPSGKLTPWVSNANQKQEGVLTGGTPYLMEFTRRHVDNGDSQLRIRIGSAVSPIASGTWKLEIQSYDVPEGGDIHAWIERGGGVPSSFQNHADESMTLSIPGTAQSVITVGAVEAAKPIRVGDFSSYGPTRDKREKPELAAPGVNVRAARAGTNTDIVSMNGTSMAAPHVTGAIALLLSRRAALGHPQLTASQINSALRQKTINYNSRWDRGQGFGIVDVAALLAAF